MVYLRLSLMIKSVADMDLQRATALARAFDAHPALRPRRVGGDPARIKVEPSMEAVMVKHGLPIQWLTFREMKPELEMGELTLLPGRGSAAGIQREDGTWEYDLWGNWLEQRWNPAVVDDPVLLAEVARLFEDLALAFDAAWGAVHVIDRAIPAGPAVWRKLAGVFWINFFGPAFLTSHPGLAAVPGARVLPGGGVLIRTADEPWTGDDLPAAAVAVRELFEPRAFEVLDPNPALPSMDDQLAATPGTDEMPWVAWERAKAQRSSEKRHANARKRLDAALDARPTPELAEDAMEWSTSFDLADWKAFAGYLRRKLRGELSSPIGTALLAVIASAPLDEEDAVVLTTDLGVIRLGWFIDDTETVDLYLWGSDDLGRLCDAWFA